ncbi:hypothetical protein RV06_GL000465 [Enterococcus haemoperoxidus]|nr:hypothetical protein RV06_GL000465 [Enterococcus haemoperoxidus]
MRYDDCDKIKKKEKNYIFVLITNEEKSKNISIFFKKGYTINQRILF